MISAGDFKNGVTLEIDGNVVQIIEFQHVKPGKGAAFVRAKLKKRYQRRRGGENLPPHGRNSRRLVSSVRICSIFTATEISIIS